MSKQKNNTSFWLSYADLMTSLFFIMLVFFIVSYIRMSIKISEGQKLTDELNAIKDSVLVENEKLNQITQLTQQFKDLSNSTVLEYRTDKKTFIAPAFEKIEIFRPESSEIQEQHLSTVDSVGDELEKLLKQLNKNNPNFSFLLVIEGNSANNGHMDPDREYNYRLSYDRALALYRRWTKEKEKQIDLRKYNTEILICGSGLNGINRDTFMESNNKRFVIQIIPKILKPN